MVKSRSKILMVIILTILMLICVTSSVFADNTAIILPTGTDNNTANSVANAENTTENTKTNSTETTNIAANNTTSILTSNNTVSQYNTTTNTTALPKTGESDIYVVTALIAICGVSAIYAYKKIRDYNM